MSLQALGELRALQFESLQQCPVAHAVFTRHGGVSSGPWHSLNVGNGVGDDPSNVSENVRRILACVDRQAASLFSAHQVHGSAVAIAEPAWADRGEATYADAVVTDNPRLTLSLRFADCVPIFLVDPVHRAIGLVHAGWKGTVGGVVEHAVRAMRAEFGTRAADLVTALGPAIGAHHYPVGGEVVQAMIQAHGPWAWSHIHRRAQGWNLDLPSANRWLLERLGVRQIEDAGICTACETADWFSHRGEGGRTGRFGAVLALRE